MIGCGLICEKLCMGAQRLKAEVSVLRSMDEVPTTLANHAATSRTSNQARNGGRLRHLVCERASHQSGLPWRALASLFNSVQREWRCGAEAEGMAQALRRRDFGSCPARRRVAASLVDSEARKAAVLDSLLGCIVTMNADGP